MLANISTPYDVHLLSSQVKVQSNQHQFLRMDTPHALLKQVKQSSLAFYIVHLHFDGTLNTSLTQLSPKNDLVISITLSGLLLVSVILLNTNYPCVFSTIKDINLSLFGNSIGLFARSAKPELSSLPLQRISPSLSTYIPNCICKVWSLTISQIIQLCYIHFLLNGSYKHDFCFLCIFTRQPRTHIFISEFCHFCVQSE